MPIEIRTDSQYTIMCMTAWLPGWKKNGFMTSGQDGWGPQPIKNEDMIKHLSVLVDQRVVRWKYVIAHSNVKGNNKADVCIDLLHSAPCRGWLMGSVSPNGEEGSLHYQSVGTG